MQKSFYDFIPIQYPVFEAIQNYARNDIEEYDEKELKDEYKRALNEKKDLEDELEDAKKAKLTTYGIVERIQNTDKYIERLEDRMEELGISTKEKSTIQQSAKGRYKIKAAGTD